MVEVNWCIATDSNSGVFSDSIHNAYGRTIEDELADQENGVHSLYLGFSGEALIGAGFIRWLGPRPEEALARYPNTPEIFRVGIDPEFQSRGIGTGLIRLLEAEAGSRGYSSVGLGVSHANVRARKLYLRLGYVDTDIRDYVDEYQYTNEAGQVMTAQDRCCFMLKREMLCSTR